MGDIMTELGALGVEALVRHCLINHGSRLPPDHVQHRSWRLSHQHSHQFRLRVDPEQRASNPAPGKVTGRTWQRIAASVDANGEAEAETGAHFGNRTKCSERHGYRRVALSG